MLPRLALLVALAFSLTVPVRGHAQAAAPGDASASAEATPAEPTEAQPSQAPADAAPAGAPGEATDPPSVAPAAAAMRTVVVIEGDCSRTAVEAARALEAALVASGEIVLPSDEATREALFGARGSVGDGLDEVRAIRRRVGWGASADREALDALAEHLDLVAVVVVRGGSEHAARVFDATAHRYFQGAAVLDAETTGEAFVLARIRRAAGRRIDAPAAAATEPSPLDGADEAPVQRSWIRRNWPFVVAGALLVGASTFFIMQRHDVDTSAPVIHVRPATP